MKLAVTAVTPLSIRLSGDREAAERLIPYARFNRLPALKRIMELGGLQQYRLQWPMADGSMIRCASVFGFDVIEIHVPKLVQARGITEYVLAVLYEKDWSFDDIAEMGGAEASDLFGIEYLSISTDGNYSWIPESSLNDYSLDTIWDLQKIRRFDYLNDVCSELSGYLGIGPFRHIVATGRLDIAPKFQRVINLNGRYINIAYSELGGYSFWNKSSSQNYLNTNYFVNNNVVDYYPGGPPYYGRWEFAMSYTMDGNTFIIDPYLEFKTTYPIDINDASEDNFWECFDNDLLSLITRWDEHNIIIWASGSNVKTYMDPYKNIPFFVSHYPSYTNDFNTSYSWWLARSEAGSTITYGNWKWSDPYVLSANVSGNNDVYWNCEYKDSWDHTEEQCGYPTAVSVYVSADVYTIYVQLENSYLSANVTDDIGIITRTAGNIPNPGSSNVVYSWTLSELNDMDLLSYLQSTVLPEGTQVNVVREIFYRFVDAYSGFSDSDKEAVKNLLTDEIIQGDPFDILEYFNTAYCGLVSK